MSRGYPWPWRVDAIPSAASAPPQKEAATPPAEVSVTELVRALIEPLRDRVDALSANVEDVSAEVEEVGAKVDRIDGQVAAIRQAVISIRGQLEALGKDRVVALEPGPNGDTVVRSTIRGWRREEIVKLVMWGAIASWGLAGAGDDAREVVMGLIRLVLGTSGAGG